ncbi:GGDEF domain-containing protein [Shewanella gaetbuli]|uniref:diguanylate cyclase n=1 Tax=Shewanella gaetbuli TaxID=220752 RepID=A0A9X1ZTC2_9GAMM|nr:GGDEF domain-containing protein [Shewanella gaetbuli]MCL1141771.1 GGDEF domain-containing protein [Shewanella gaetbuli]
MKYWFVIGLIFLNLMLVKGLSASELFDDNLNQIEKLLQTDVTQAESMIDSMLSTLDQLTPQQAARFYTLTSIKHLYSAEHQLADKALDTALSFTPSEEVLTQIYLYKVTVNILLKDYEKAFSILQFNLSRIKEFEDTQLKVASYVRLLNILLDLTAYDEMLSTAKLVLNLNQGKDSKNECYAMLYHAVATLKLTQYSQANSLFKQSEVYCAENGQPLIEAMSIKGQGISYFELDKYAVAKPLLEDALERYEGFKFQIEINDVKAYLSKIYFYEGNFDKAQQYAEELNGLNEEKINIDVKKQANEVLAMLASKNGDFGKAYQHQVVAHALDLQALNEVNHKQNAYQMARFTSAEKERENQSLLQEHEIMMQQKDLILKEKSSSIMFSTLLFGVCVGLGLLLLTAWFQRNKFRQQAQRDGLTGIFNRKTGQDLAENELVNVLSQSSQYSVLILDLDHFKTINDRFGHATGDWTLKKVTRVVQDIIRPTDIFCRLGGEEFAVYFPHTDELTALKVAESIRHEIEQINTKYSGHNFSISVSGGVSSLDKDDLSVDPILKRADIALYKSKKTGRNKVLAYQPSFE